MNHVIFSYHFVDWNGNPIKRTPYSNPYTYDAHVIDKRADKYEHAVYSDRLLQQDYNKHNTLCKKHFGDEGQYWDNRDFNTIQAFLRDFHNKLELTLVGIMKGCNVSNGYPYWIFMINFT